MRLLTIADLRHRLTLGRSKGGDIHQRLHTDIGSRRDHRTGVRMRGKNNRPARTIQHPIQCLDVVAQGRQGNRGCDHIESLGPQSADDPTPARAIRPRSMDHDYGHRFVAHGEIVGGAAAAFLSRVAEFYAMRADLRNCLGVRPTARLKYVQSLLWSENPALAAMSTSGRSQSHMSCCARSTRRARRYWCGGTPVAALNCRAK